jgi:hypothetical protein
VDVPDDRFVARKEEIKQPFQKAKEQNVGKK